MKGLHRKNQLDKAYFNKIDTEEKAYWLGYIYADGNIYIDKRGVHRLLIVSKDEEILINFNRCLKSNHPYKYYDTAYRTYVVCKQLVQDLMNYGLTPKKAFTISCPKLRPSLVRHFIRGYFDGDGSIMSSYYTYHKRMYNRFCITSGSKSFLEEIQKYMISSTQISLNKIVHSKKHYELSYGGDIMIQKIYHYMYDKSHLSLTRKKVKFQTIFKIRKEKTDE